MCYFDGDEYPELSVSTWRRAAKTHSCFECGRTIAKGERYENVFHVQDRQPLTIKTCEQCVEARGWLAEECHGWMFGCVAEDLGEHDDPEAKRLAALMDAQWIVDGRLLAVEEIGVALPVHAPAQRAQRSETFTMGAPPSTL